ncbi:class I adenylate-forming enzyme family protein [Brevibacterium jeotgali]|uniref:Feruloyl-CoA synthase n=1 Tax=Brevibacterium jeotgali TaxID=1262550 RepID=A0A2H1L6X0_9MICO|nr:AMP-binding protein [Brevibacterium jeotgali]TWC02301.1 feruloyl-CoA synthase [Brevibacterium jeotgali]SMY12647.1 feruloyl-CoA synthase [Brevibacterium jeotgali]
MKLSTMLRGSAMRAPQAQALVSGDTTWTYTELVGESEKAAGVLADRGVRSGDTVAAMTFNEPAFVFTAFGAWMLGATFVPVNHKLQVPEVAYTVGHSGATVGVVSGELAETALAGAPDVDWLTTGAGGTFEELLAEAKPWTETHDDDRAPAEVLYTSGTTSAPKGCVHTHDSLVRLATQISLNLGYESDERILIAMPIWHSAPLNVCMLPVLLMGGTVVLQREYHPIETLELIGAERITTFFGPTVAYLAPLRAAAAHGKDFADFDFSSVRRWTFGGAPIDAAGTGTILESYQPGAHYQLFGMSETGPSGSMLRPHEQLEKPGSIGRTGMIGVQMRVVTADGTEAGPGESGEIWFLSDTVMKGYLGNPEATEAAFEGRWYKTGDIARVDEDGYYYVVDRLKDVIIVGGENVFSLEVEEAIALHPGVADVAVVGKPDPEWGQQVVAFVTPAEGDAGTGLTTEGLRGFLESKLARYKLPREVVIEESLPRNPSGKLLKHELRTVAAG